MAGSNTDPTESRRKLLDPSELGTKDYWDKVYDRELSNQREDPDDEGTVWFSESNAEDAILRQLDKLEEEGENPLRRDEARFLDLGTGNGHMLFELREEEWCGEMIGVDYSSPSVHLAQRLAAQKHAGAQTRFHCWDLLSDPPGDWLGEGFDVVLDKGTFDAISLMQQHSGSAVHPCEVYRARVTPLVKPGCFLFVTSCNWTKEELLEWLVGDGELVFYDEAVYPTFTFGGQTGQSIVTVVFQRKVT